MISYLDEVNFSVFSVKETGTPYLALTDRHLQALWFEQRPLLPLTTADGTPLKVLNPGSWNTGEGPAFLNAHICLGEKELKGNIVVSSSLLTQEEGILFVTFDGPASYFPLEKSLFLHSFIAEPIADWFATIDLDRYPYKQYSQTGHCQSFFASLPEKRIAQILSSAAEWHTQQEKTSPVDPEKTNYLKKRFFGESPKGNLLADPQLQKGALQLHNDYCQHYGEDCLGCPFVKRANFVG